MHQITFPNECWLAGKGISLDHYDWSKAGPCRVGINETAFTVPNVFAAFAYDHNILNKYLEKLNPSV